MKNVAFRSLLVALLLAPPSAFAETTGAPSEGVNAAAPSAAAPVEELDWIEQNTTDRSFLVLGTFRTYARALREAERLAPRTELELRPSATDVVDGEPSYAREVCEENGWDYPCYVARGRYDDGAYLSVEPSAAYDGLKAGYFVVIAASGTDAEVRAERVSVEQRGVRGVIRTSQVWMGCIH